MLIRKDSRHLEQAGMLQMNHGSKNQSTPKQIVGFTSGVFDLFHIGHLNILQRAKSLCDKLIVGVTVDELVGYKDAEAVIPFSERLEIVKNIKCVDLAIPQDHLDKFVMWKKLKFDVMFIGDDWYDTERFRNFEDKLAEVGVQIIYLPYTDGVSTSLIKNRIEQIKRRTSSIPPQKIPVKK